MSYILIVADAPSPSEVHSGRLYSSPGLAIIRQQLTMAGLPSNIEVRTKYVHSAPLPPDYEKNFKLKRPKPGYVLSSELGGWTTASSQNCGARFDFDMKSREAPLGILCCGNFALKLLTGKWGIGSWRGSQLEDKYHGRPLVPTYAPDTLQAQYSFTFPSKRDCMRLVSMVLGTAPKALDLRARFEPTWDEVDAFLRPLEEKAYGSEFACDLETWGGYITCVGLATSVTEAICIPFSRLSDDRTSVIHYWTPEQELLLIVRLRALFSRPGTRLVGQNFLYDLQYLCRFLCWFPPRHVKIWDTMLAWHVMYPGSRKSLDMISSMLCDHYVFWKEDKKGNEDTKDLYYLGTPDLWLYNCRDTTRTYECMEKEKALLNQLGLTRQAEQQFDYIRVCLHAMLVGLPMDHILASMFKERIVRERHESKQYVATATNNWINNPSSPKQLQEYFYGQLKLPPVLHKKTKRPTTDEDALETFVDSRPLLRPIISRVDHYRKGVNYLSVIDQRLSPAHRLVTSYNPGGTDTFRLASSINGFGEGTNEQNVTKGKEDGKALAWAPNLRRLYICDPGYVPWECDLERADLQVVVWEADDRELKQALRLQLDMHAFNAVSVFGIRGIPPEELNPRHGNYERHIAVIGYERRQRCKAGVHATNYGAAARTLAATLGISVREAEAFLKRWLSIHPGIKRWQERIEMEVQTRRMIYNKFGYRYVVLDRVDHHAVAAALAWGPQSTVAIVTRNIWIKIEERCPANEFFAPLQIHDALAGQVREDLVEKYKVIIKDFASEIVIPYEDPLVIPFDMKIHKNSWGV